MNGNKIEQLGNPSSAQDAATKNYVDTKGDYKFNQIMDFHDGVKQNKLNQMAAPSQSVNMNV